MKLRTLLVGAGIVAAGAYWLSLTPVERRETEKRIAPYLPWWLAVLIGLRGSRTPARRRALARRSSSGRPVEARRSSRRSPSRQTAAVH